MWNESFTLDVKYIGDDMQINVYDQDITCSDTVGKTSIKISALCANHGIDDWFPIQWKGRQSGQVHLKSNWTPHGTTAPGNGGIAAQAM